VPTSLRNAVTNKKKSSTVGIIQNISLLVVSFSLPFKCPNSFNFKFAAINILITLKRDR
jgi:hypothetical protein